MGARQYSVASDDPLVSTWRSPARIKPNSRRSTNRDRMQSQKCEWIESGQIEPGGKCFRVQRCSEKWHEGLILKPLLHSLSLFPPPRAELLVRRASNTLSPQPNPPPCHSDISLSPPRFIISPPSLLNPHSITSSSLVRDLEFLTLLTRGEPELVGEERGGTAPAWIFQKALIPNMTLSSVLSLWSSILPCQVFLVRGLNGSYSRFLSWGYEIACYQRSWSQSLFLWVQILNQQNTRPGR